MIETMSAFQELVQYFVAFNISQVCLIFNGFAYFIASPTLLLHRIYISPLYAKCYIE